VATQDKSLSGVGFALMPILRIAQRLEKGASLREALQRAGYANSRPSFAAADIRALLLAHPQLVDAWLGYSEAKDTPEGWYVLRDAEIGQLSRPSAQRRFASIEEAVAEFILRELDYHAGLTPAGTSAARSPDG
jgi:hypothetical protein